jgi:hypothetical protein
MNKIDTLANISEEVKSEPIRQLRLLQSAGGQITRSSPKIFELSNGLPYFFVEVTCENGRQLGIPTYGDEAIALCAEILHSMEPCIIARSR